ncbi:IS110 family transposase [Clostridium beijerinckii]|jgi:Transposase and inactivated derivatives|uniref:IS110 family transposase n=2 Tax=Clostridium beijerinckii TaxID=1520 RepID=A0AAE2V154_CLOBE|nr:IS110 family transposase [Clostridium beijerinckii]ABR35684.1 transposase IS116/IS110/IS902 family protein [Clostridium beijerinckii NCIMB 8052]AIU03969.1 transposase IS116/IS110/IS902 family protein [Clostridium beijerinckii ATCC 35702]MBF7809678.1 IS110 family transposase [Clostridium beijerinckii]NRT69547.1 transposase [Clostridium beijerinckii]NRT84306.1 transposase [Clostridium beijerinckii]
MISVGIDVSKEKSTVCILKPYGEIVRSPYEITHTESQIAELVSMIKCLDDEVRVVMEATGNYHLPVLSFLKEHGIFVAVINPLIMKKYASIILRKGKTDKLDSIKIANYGLDNWFHLINHESSEEIYVQLRLLGRQYGHYIKLRIESKLSLTTMLDYTMPGIKTMLKSRSDKPEKDKLNDFIEEYWHYDNITKKSENQFISNYKNWAKKKGYQQSEAKAIKIYDLAQQGIPTLSSNAPSTKMLVLEAVRVLREIDKTLALILSQMQELAKSLKEYTVVREMAGVGDIIAPRLMAEIGDIRRFHSGKALIAYAGIDAPPYQSGQFTGTRRRISKRGSATLRKTGFEIMKCLKSNKPESDTVYLFVLKKEAEGKASKVAKIAGLNKFLRIYYARVKEVYK